MIDYGERPLMNGLAERQHRAGTPTEPVPVRAYTMDMKALAKSPFMGRTRPGPGHAPRPEPTDRKYQGRNGAESLAEDRAAWDVAEAWAAENDAIRADRIAREEAQREADRKARADAETAARTAARADLEARLKGQFMANPAALESDWTAAKDRIVAAHLEEQAVTADRQARLASARLYD